MERSIGQAAEGQAAEGWRDQSAKPPNSEGARPRRQSPPPPWCHLRARGGRALESCITLVTQHRRPDLDPKRFGCRVPEVACVLLPSASRAARQATRRSVPGGISRRSKKPISTRERATSLLRDSACCAVTFSKGSTGGYIQLSG